MNPPPRQDGDHYNNNNDRGRGDAAQEEEELRVAVQARLVQQKKEVDRDGLQRVHGGSVRDRLVWYRTNSAAEAGSARAAAIVAHANRARTLRIVAAADGYVKKSAGLSPSPVRPRHYI